MSVNKREMWENKMGNWENMMVKKDCRRVKLGNKMEM